MSIRKSDNEDILPKVTRGASNVGNTDTTAKKPNYKAIDKENRKLFLIWAYRAICVLAIGLCVASFSVKSLQKASLKGLKMWQWCLLIAALLSGPLLSYGIIEFLLLFIDRDFSIRENVIYYVVGLGESAAVVLWFSMILLAWLWVIDEPSYLGMPQQDLSNIKAKYGMSFHIITMTLLTLILGSFLWLLKDLVVKKAKSEFHIRRFYDRIKTALLHQYIIERLCRGSPITMMKPVELTTSSSYTKRLRHSFKKVGLGRGEKRFINLSSFEDVSQENVSCWGMKILIQGILENPNLCFTITSDKEKVSMDSDSQAIKVAEHILPALQAEDRSIGIQELLKKIPEKQHEVRKCLVEESRCANNEAVSLEKWMVNIYRYRNALYRALEANGRLFTTLNRFINALLTLAIFALWLIIIRVQTRKVIFLIGTAILGSAFIIGDTCTKFISNILFVFLAHPFDIGDCCRIDDTLAIIEEITFLTTTMVTFDNEMKQYPNSVLSGQCITNYSRSPQHIADSVTIPLDIHTSTQKIDRLQKHISSYIEKHQQYWNKEHNWVMELETNDNAEDINNALMIKLTLRIQHTINYQELTDRQTRKSELVLEFKKVLDHLGAPDDTKPVVIFENNS